MNVNRWREILQAPNEKKNKKTKKTKERRSLLKKKCPSHIRRMKFCWDVRKETRLFIHFAKVTTWLKRSIEIERYFSRKAKKTFLTLDYQTNGFSFFDPGIISMWYTNCAGELVYVMMPFGNDKQRKRKFPWRLLIIKYHVQWATPYRSSLVVWTLGKTGCTAQINFTFSLLSISRTFCQERRQQSTRFDKFLASGKMAAQRSFAGNCSIISHHHHELQNFGAAVVCLSENVYTQRSFKFPFIHRVTALCLRRLENCSGEVWQAQFCWFL